MRSGYPSSAASNATHASSASFFAVARAPNFAQAQSSKRKPKPKASPPSSFLPASAFSRPTGPASLPPQPRICFPRTFRECGWIPPCLGTAPIGGHAPRSSPPFRARAKVDIPFRPAVSAPAARDGRLPLGAPHYLGPQNRPRPLTAADAPRGPVHDLIHRGRTRKIRKDDKIAPQICHMMNPYCWDEPRKHAGKDGEDLVGRGTGTVTSETF